MKRIFPDRIKSSSLMLLILASTFATLIVVNPVLPVHAYTVPNTASASISTSSTTQPLTVANSGDLIVVEVQYHANSAGTPFNNGSQFAITVAGTRGDTSFTLATFTSISFGPAKCNACAEADIWYAVTTSSGSDSITVTVPNLAAFSGAFEAEDVVGVPVNIQALATGDACHPNPACPSTTSFFTLGNPSANGANTFAVSSQLNGCTNGHIFTAGAGFTALIAGGSVFGGAEYGTPPNGITGPTQFPMTCNIAVTNWIDIGAIFGASFTCKITNLDGPNYLIANTAGNNGKFYNFFCQIQSAAIGTNAAITDVKVRFNDSNTGSCTLTCFSVSLPNIVVLEYNNATQQGTIDQGGNLATLGNPTVVNSFNSATKVRSMNVTFPVSLNGNAVNSQNRGIELFASTANQSRGFSYVQKKYFNILTSGNGGGGISTLSNSGLCAIPSGADVFQMICQYGVTAHNWIAENTTYYQLQQYQSQFSIQLNDQFGNQNPAFWQDFGHSGGGTNPSSNSKDWQIRTGLYHWDNTSATCCWVKGINLRLYMDIGSVGSNNLWTEFTAEWYQGSHLYQNQTFFAFVPSSGNGNSQVGIWLNFWYSQNNGSTKEGGEVGAYFTGMHQTGALIWTSWSPLFQNQTQVQTFVPLNDHSGNLMAAQQAQLSMVFMNMSRPGAPARHANQANFQILTTNFQEQEFNVASGGMTGITTPTFAVAVIPTVQSNSIFSPIVNAIKSIASYFVKGLMAIGTVVWNGLGARFPWFTGTLSTFGAWILGFYKFLFTVAIYVVEAISFIYSAVSLVVYPITAIANGWTTITTIYLPIFKGANLQAMLILVVLWVFSGYVIDNAERGDTKGFIALAAGAWRVVYTVFNVTWMIAKFLVDAVEGLIP